MSKTRLVAERIRRHVRENFEFVDLNDAHFLWHHEPNEGGKWLEEAFVVLPHTVDDKVVARLGLNELSSSAGADGSGWPTSIAQNPGFLFGQVLAMEWLSELEKIEAIAEFGKVRELDWAREHLRGMGYQHGAFEDQEIGPLRQPMNSIAEVEAFRDKLVERAT
uniref:hypothetical protein n=1 Tax=Parerythrobacter lutipelagi TaxID=1964208 RepID=UPI0010F43B6F|nr:hypothetical protein [Parerythrobacter lutipelagi]